MQRWRADAQAEVARGAGAEKLGARSACWAHAEVDGLMRKLNTLLAPAAQDFRPGWRVGECLATYYRCCHGRGRAAACVGVVFGVAAQASWEQAMHTLSPNLVLSHDTTPHNTAQPHAPTSHPLSRPNFENAIYPYCPPHVTRPKEVKRIWHVVLPDRSFFSVGTLVVSGSGLAGLHCVLFYVAPGTWSSRTAPSSR